MESLNISKERFAFTLRIEKKSSLPRNLGDWEATTKIEGIPPSAKSKQYSSACNSTGHQLLTKGPSSTATSLVMNSPANCLGCDLVHWAALMEFTNLPQKFRRPDAFQQDNLPINRSQ